MGEAGFGLWRSQGAQASGSAAFLFFGELFLIPHLLPIATALARTPDAPQITLFVITTIHEEIIRDAVERLGLVEKVRIRRAAGFRHFPAGCRDMPDLPPKLLVLALNAPAIMRHDVAVVAERTSLWLPRVARRMGANFIYNEHGAAPHANFGTARNRFATRILMPGAGMAQRVRDSGHEDAPIELVGYIKRDFIREVSGTGNLPPFKEKRPTVVYVPHWLQSKSSWWAMGEQVLDHFARSTAYNLIVAPHIRLPEVDPDFEKRIHPYCRCPNIHIDSGSFRLIDQSYINGADIYLGDGSSQVVEFAERPRPAIFLNPDHVDWRADPRFSHWTMGDVITDIADLDHALEAAPAAFEHYAPIQRAYVERMMGADDGRSSERAAAVVLEVIAERRMRHGWVPRPAHAASEVTARA
jgi:hypothetical protein